MSSGPKVKLLSKLCVRVHVNICGSMFCSTDLGIEKVTSKFLVVTEKSV